MGRRRKGRPISGWVIIDKPEGITSTKVVSRVRWAFQAEKAGHAGTLDPLASGLLPVALGEATKTVPYLVDATKAYRFVAAWGEAKSTDDREGEVTARSTNRPEEAAIRAVLDRFTGEISQVPPAFSAIKVNGERAYDLARAGEAPELKPRIVTIHKLELVSLEGVDRATFEITCGKGTYVRSLVRDLALALGTVGHVAEIRRLRVGPFHETDAIPLSKLDEMGNSAAATSLLRPLQTALDDIPALALGPQEAIRLKRGQTIVLRPVYASRLEDWARARTGDEVGQARAPTAVEELLGEDGFGPEGSSQSLPCTHALCMHKGQPIAICRLDSHELKPVRVFNLPWIGEADVDYAGT